MLLQVTLKAKWELIEFPHYKWSECRQLVNAKTGKIIKKTTNGRGVKVGYYINRKFIKVEDLISGKLVQKIEVKQTPF
jgi:hypothetical protein